MSHRCGASCRRKNQQPKCATCKGKKKPNGDNLMKKKVAVIATAAAITIAAGVAAFTIPSHAETQPYAGYGADLEQVGHVAPYGLGYALDLEQTGHVAPYGGLGYALDLEQAR